MSIRRHVGHIMRYYVFFLLLSISFLSIVDEPSVAYKCQRGLRTFINERDSTARIDTCPEGDNLRIDAVTFGANYHMCWLTGIAKISGKQYQITDSDCELNFSITDDELVANFKGKCRFVCGARAWFKGGTYKQKDP
jgi:hypothetical protein